MWKLLNLGNDEVFQVLEKRDLKGVAKYMQSDACKHVFVMVSEETVFTASNIDYVNVVRLHF